MPYSIRKAPGGGYRIVNKSTGKTVGKSATKAKAQKSVNARNAGAHGWKGSRRR